MSVHVRCRESGIAVTVDGVDGAWFTVDGVDGSVGDAGDVDMHEDEERALADTVSRGELCAGVHCAA